MGHGHQHIKPTGGVQLPTPTTGDSPVAEKHLPKSEEQTPKSPKANAAVLFDKKWQDTQAADRRGALTTLVPDGKEQKQTNGRSATTATMATPNQPKEAQRQVEQSKILLSQSTHGESPVAEKHLPKSEEQTPNNPKANAAVLFDKKWQDTQAADKRGVLTTLVPDAKEQKQQTNGGSSTTAAATATPNQTNGRTARAVTTAATAATATPNQPKEAPRQVEQSKILLSQSWNDLLGRAKEHKNLENFRGEPKEFWDKVRQMSEIRVVDSYVKGKLEPRATSRYGDLLEMLNRRGGSSNLVNFLNSLPRAERNVFLARLQINQTFGANEFFTGRAGVALDRNGRFGLQTFLAGNGKATEIGANAIISLAGGDLSAETLLMLEKSGVFANAPMLFDSKSASLLGLTLALYQNTDALLSLDEMNFEAFIPKIFVEMPSTMPKTFDEMPSSMPKTFGELPSSNALLNNTSAALRGGNFENSKTADNAAVTKRAGEMLAAGALISGALATIEQHRKANKTSAGSWGETAADDAGFRFSAGSTGAMMGATVGCVVPLAQKSVGEILGFAASVVVGLTDSGLRTLGANALVSVITGGVQTFLNVSSAAQNALPDGASNKFLNAAQASAGEQILEKDLRQIVFNRRTDAFLTS